MAVQRDKEHFLIERNWFLSSEHFLFTFALRIYGRRIIPSDMVQHKQPLDSGDANRSGMIEMISKKKNNNFFGEK